MGMGVSGIFSDLFIGGSFPGCTTSGKARKTPGYFLDGQILTSCVYDPSSLPIPSLGHFFWQTGVSIWNKKE